MYRIINDHGYIVEVTKEKYDEWKTFIQAMNGNGYEAKLHDGMLLMNPLSTRKFGPEPVQGPPGLYDEILKQMKNA